MEVFAVGRSRFCVCRRAAQVDAVVERCSVYRCTPSLLVLFRCSHCARQMLALAAAATVLALPRVIYSHRPCPQSGTTVSLGLYLERPTILNVLKYHSFTFVQVAANRFACIWRRAFSGA
jgi:hypothetical protein